MGLGWTGSLADSCARRARTMRMCSLDARNWSRPGHPSQSMRWEKKKDKNR